jgi:hypothetical protein
VEVDGRGVGRGPGDVAAQAFEALAVEGRHADTCVQVARDFVL